MRTKLFTLSLLLLFLGSYILPVPARAAAPTPVIAGQLGGVTRAVAFSDGQLYFNVGPRIVRMAVSASDPGKPTKPGAYSEILPGIPQDIKIADGYIYAALGYAGVAVVDAGSLRMVSAKKLSAGSYAAAVAVGSSFLYVAAGDAGIVAYNLGMDKKTLSFSQAKTFNNPVRNITDVETILTAGGTQESLLACANNYSVPPTTRGGILKFDITTSPLLDAPVKAKEEIDVNALALDGNYVYAAADKAFYALDLAELGGSGGTFGSLALTNTPANISLGAGAGTLYLLNGAGIDVVDASTPSAPALLTAQPFASKSVALGLAAANFAGSASTYLYLADFDAGLSVASSPQGQPQDLSLDSPSYLLPRPAIARTVAGAQGQAFVVSNSSSLWTVDTNRPGALVVVGAGIDSPSSIDYLTTYQNLLPASASASGLLRFQINPGSEPTSQGSFVTDGPAYKAVVAWPNAIVADGANGLVVVNIDGPLALTGWSEPPQFDSDFRSLDVQGNFAYVADNNGTFRVYDISDPTGPFPRGILHLAGVLDVKVSGNFAYLACGEQGVRVVDISNPDAPVLVGDDDLALPGLAQSLALSQDILWVAGGSGGVHMLTMQPASGHLDLATTIATSGSATQLALGTDDLLYVADEEGGLVVIKFGPNKYYLPFINR